MTSATTNYGTSLGKQDTSLAFTTIGELVSIDPPEMMTPAVEATNHGSGGYREFISSKLNEDGEFKATINYVKAKIALLNADRIAGTVGQYEVAFDSNNRYQFGALVTGIKPLTADAQNPEVMKAEVTFRPTGTLTLTS